MTAQADQAPPPAPLGEIFVSFSSEFLVSYLILRIYNAYFYTLYCIHYLIHCKKTHIYSLIAGYALSQVIHRIQYEILFWKPWLVFEMVRYGWPSVSDVAFGHENPPPPFLFQRNLDWHSLLLVSAHGHEIITIFIYHHHLSSSSKNLTVCFNHSTLRGAKSERRRRNW